MPLADAAGRSVAAVLAQRSEDDPDRPLYARGLLSELDRRGLPASLAEEWLDRFLRAGWIAVRWRLGRGVPALIGVTVRNPEALAELAEPGAAANRWTALQAARARVAGLTHPFEASCRGEVEGAAGSLLAWSGGYPGRAVRNLVERAAAAGAPVRIWADLDLDGVRIARLISSWIPSGEVLPWRMSPQDLAAAPETLPLSPRSQAALRRDLGRAPRCPPLRHAPGHSRNRPLGRAGSLPPFASVRHCACRLRLQFVAPGTAQPRFEEDFILIRECL